MSRSHLPDVGEEALEESPGADRIHVIEFPDSFLLRLRRRHAKGILPIPNRENPMIQTAHS